MNPRCYSMVHNHPQFGVLLTSEKQATLQKNPSATVLQVLNRDNSKRNISIVSNPWRYQGNSIVF